ncbi:MAG: SOS response-associated peptidase [Bacteroidales bacterium]|nr:SOS response-associated peptidase [Bacteroidales bacterium]
MCGRYVLVQKIEVLEQRFNVTTASDFIFEPSYNISPGDLAPVITCEAPRTLQLFRFGLTPFWAKKRMYLFNARVEGDRNKENNPQYNGAKDIILKPAFRKPIRQQRCLIPADAFIEGTTNEGLSNPFLVHLQNKERPFSFAGIYDSWLNPESQNIEYGFSIITTTANELMQKIPHHRCPVILPRHAEKVWLNKDAHLTDLLKLLIPLDSKRMNAFPISAEIKSPKSNDKSLILPIGQPLQAEISLKTHQEIKLEGMGNRNRQSDTKKNSNNAN